MRALAAGIVALVLATAGVGWRASADPAAAADDPATLVARWQQRAPVRGVVVAGDGLPTIARGVPAAGRFRVASITKTFVATVVLQLVEEGALALDERAVERLQHVDGVDDAALARLLDEATVRQLLAHTAGVPDYGRVQGLRDLLLGDPAREWTPGEVVALVADREREFAPGAAHDYSNTGYVLLGELVRAVTGRSWDEEVRRRILVPLGLDATGFAAGPGLVPGWFDLDADGFDDQVPAEPWPALESTEGAAGVMFSTATDLVRFGRALADGELLAPATLARMQAPGPHGLRHRGYGLGVEVRRPDHATTVWGHGGALPGYRSVLWVVPERDAVLVVLTNAWRSNPEDLAELLLGR